MFCEMLLTTMVTFKIDTKQDITVLYSTTIEEVQNTKTDFQKFSFFVFCNLYSTRNGLIPKNGYSPPKRNTKHMALDGTHTTHCQHIRAQNFSYTSF